MWAWTRFPHALGVLLVVVSMASPAFAQQRVVRVGFVADGPWERNAEVTAVFQREILEITQGEFDVRFPASKVRVADWTETGVRAAVDAALADPQIDIVVALGTLVGADVCKRGALAKPVIAPFIVDSELAGVPFREGTSGVTNLSYLASPGTVDRDLSAFTEVAEFTRLTVLSNGVLLAALEGLREHFIAAGQRFDLDVTVVSVVGDAAQALAAIPPDAEAIYITPLLNLPDGDFDRLIAGINARGLPSFSLFGRIEVNRGVLAGVATADFFLRTARRVALHVQSTLLGDDPGTLSVDFSADARLTINMATARAVGVFPSFAVLTEAELINEGSSPERSVSLASAVREAMAVNLDLAAEERRVAAGERGLGEVRALLRPEVQLETRGLVIDEDRAVFGTAERKWSGHAKLTQLLFSEPAWANLSIEQRLQDARRLEREQLRLDIARAAATSFLDLLRASAFERIQKDNLNLTRSNLELARLRVRVGSSSRADLLRWENQIAQNRIAVIDAIAVRNVAEIQLNRLLHRPTEESFATQETDLDDPSLLAVHQRLQPYVDNPWAFRRFRSFMARQALLNAPELRQFEVAIAAQERALRSATRAFWLPQLALQADLAREFADGGAGARTQSGNLPFALPDETDWSVGVRASIPLFAGGARFATRSRASEDLARLRIERDALAERIEQRVRLALHNAGASRAAIALSAEAARAANENLELVTDAYSRGVLDILDLLDAQNAVLSSDLLASNAIHEYLSDWMDVERGSGFFFLLMTPEQIDTWFAELERTFEDTTETSP